LQKKKTGQSRSSKRSHLSNGDQFEESEEEEPYEQLMDKHVLKSMRKNRAYYEKLNVSEFRGI